MNGGVGRGLWHYVSSGPWHSSREHGRRHSNRVPIWSAGWPDTYPDVFSHARFEGAAEVYWRVPLPDGRTLPATGSLDATVAVWDPITTWFTLNDEEIERAISDAAASALVRPHVGESNATPRCGWLSSG